METFYDYYKIVGVFGEEGRSQPQRSAVRHRTRPTSTPLTVKLEKVKRTSYGKLKLYEMEILSPVERKVYKSRWRKTGKKQSSAWMRDRSREIDPFVNPSLTIVDFNRMAIGNFSSER